MEEPKTIYLSNVDSNNKVCVEGVGYVTLSTSRLSDDDIQYNLVPKEIESFNEFFDRYHELSGKRRTDKAAAMKYWKQMTLRDRNLATNNLERYIKSHNDLRYVKKARTYLSDRNYEDEFESDKKELFSF